MVQSEIVRRVPESDEHLLKGSIRIAPTGLSLSRHSDLTLVASLSGRAGRDKEYFERFLQGKAGWYHIPVSTTENYKVTRTAIREVRYCAIAVSSTGVPDRRVEFLYDVLTIRLVRRNELTLDQAGKIDLSNSAYWLFELGTSRTLKPLAVLENEASVYAYRSAGYYGVAGMEGSARQVRFPPGRTAPGFGRGSGNEPLPDYLQHDFGLSKGMDS